MKQKYCKGNTCRHWSEHYGKCFHGNNVGGMYDHPMTDSEGNCKYIEAKAIEYRGCDKCRHSGYVNDYRSCKVNEDDCKHPKNEAWQARACGFCEKFNECHKSTSTILKCDSFKNRVDTPKKQEKKAINCSFCRWSSDVNEYIVGDCPYANVCTLKEKHSWEAKACGKCIHYSYGDCAKEMFLYTPEGNIPECQHFRNRVDASKPKKERTKHLECKDCRFSGKIKGNKPLEEACKDCRWEEGNNWECIRCIDCKHISCNPNHCNRKGANPNPCKDYSYGEKYKVGHCTNECSENFIWNGKPCSKAHFYEAKEEKLCVDCKYGYNEEPWLDCKKKCDESKNLFTPKDKEAKDTPITEERKEWNCKDCKHYGKKQLCDYASECGDRDEKGHWEAKEVPKKEKHSCYECKYKEVSLVDIPCRDCNLYRINWEAKDTPTVKPCMQCEYENKGNWRNYCDTGHISETECSNFTPKEKRSEKYEDKCLTCTLFSEDHKCEAPDRNSFRVNDYFNCANEDWGSYVKRSCETCGHNLGLLEGYANVTCEIEDGLKCAHGDISGGRQWKNWIPIPKRTCETCRFSRKNTGSEFSMCPSDTWKRTPDGCGCGKTNNYHAWKAIPSNTTKEQELIQEGLEVQNDIMEEQFNHLKDIHYLYTDGVELINKHKENCPYITCEEYEDCRKQDFNVICLKEFENKTTNKKEVKEMDVKDIESKKKEIEEIEEKREKIINKRKELIYTLDGLKDFTHFHYYNWKSYNVRHFNREFIDFISEKAELSKDIKKAFTELNLEGYYGAYERNRHKCVYIKKSKVEQEIYKLREEWKIYKIILNAIKDFKYDWLYKDAEDKLCAIKKCYNELSDDKPVCKGCKREIPAILLEDPEAIRCIYCGERVE